MTEATTAPPKRRGASVEARRAAPRFPRSLDDVYAFAVIAVAVGAALMTVVGPHDFWWHLDNGRQITGTGVFPTHDTATWTQTGQPFFNQMWLAQVIMFLLYRAGGIPLIVLAHAAAIGVAYTMLLRLCVREAASKRLAALILLVGVLPLSFMNWAVRPQPYAFPLFATFLLILWTHGRGERSRNRLWLLPLVMAVWVNVHGSFPLGLALYAIALGVSLVGLDRSARASSRRELVVWALPTFAAVLVNPRGGAVVAYVGGLLGSSSVAAHVTEWQPTGLNHLSGWIYFALLGALILVLSLTSRRPPFRHVAMVTAFILLGLTARRHTLWAAFVCAPLFAAQLKGLLGDRRVHPKKPTIERAFVAVLMLLVIVASPWVRPRVIAGEPGQLTKYTPVEAVSYLQSLDDELLPRRIYNDLGFGSYMTWAFPQLKTFIDTRFELFPEEQVLDMRALNEGRNVELLISKYDFDGFILSHRYQEKLIDHLRLDASWRLAYEDDEAVVFLPAG